MKKDKQPKKLLFIHDALPSEGISGMVVFLRHFTRLQNWNIEILIPENAYREDVVKSYPSNFRVKTFPLRKKTWPPFRDHIPLLVKVRLLVLRVFFRKIISAEKPDAIVSVLFHYYGVAASQVAKEMDINFVLFLHDRWDLKIDHPVAQKIRVEAGRKALLNASHVLSVTENLISSYGIPELKNVHVFFPIPEGYLTQYNNRSENGIRLLYAGTIEDHHIRFFKSLIPIVERNNYTLTIVTNKLEIVKKALGENKNMIYQPSFKGNNEVLEFIDRGRYVIIINYGLDENDNKFVMHSFPSKFVEFSSLGLPMVAIGYERSPFYKFLSDENWPLLFCNNDLHTLEDELQKLESDQSWKEKSDASKSLFEKYFRPEYIQSRFEGYLNSKLK